MEVSHKKPATGHGCVQHSDRAVILGGSIAGLLAARALADTYAEVVILERDHLGQSIRRGTPQAAHAHALLAAGQRALEGLFPGFTDELQAAGAPIGDVLADVDMHLSGYRQVQTRAGLVAVSASRSLLEDRIRRRVAEHPNVSFSPPADALGLATSGGSVRGVLIIRRDDSSPAETLFSDLVVDATGRGSRVATWMAAEGLEPPPISELNCGARYATTDYPKLPGDGDQPLALVDAPTQARPRGCVLARIDGQRWRLTLAGMNGEQPPADQLGFDNYAKSLSSPLIDAILDRPPAADPILYRFPSSRRRHFERLRQPPSGLIAVGDSIASFNPIYGQGMTVAALEAVVLQRHAASRGAVDPAAWFACANRIVSPVWAMAAAADAVFAGPAARRRDRIATRYIRSIHALGASDADAATTFARVAGLVDRPHRLLRPLLAARILRSQILQARRNKTPSVQRPPTAHKPGVPT